MGDGCLRNTPSAIPSRSCIPCFSEARRLYPWVKRLTKGNPQFLPEYEREIAIPTRNDASGSLTRSTGEGWDSTASDERTRETSEVWACGPLTAVDSKRQRPGRTTPRALDSYRPVP